MKLIQKSFLILLLTGLLGLLLWHEAPPGSNGYRIEGALIEGQASEILPIAVDRSVSVPVRKAGASDPEILARAALVKDYESGLILLEKNRNQLLPIASLTKLMTAIVAKKNLPFNEMVEITRQDLDVPPYRTGFSPGQKVNVESLIKAMLISSANDAAMALARTGGSGDVRKFVSDMNAQARSLGMRQTSFANPVGFDHPDHYSTAVDLAKLVEEFLQYPELLRIVSQPTAVIETIDGRNKNYLTTTNRLMIAHREVIGLKTGYTSEARGNLIIFVDLEASEADELRGKYYSIILGSEDRERETLAVMNWIKDNYQWRK